MKDKTLFYFLVGFGILQMFFCMLFITAFSFSIGMVISPVLFIISVVYTFLVNFLLIRFYYKKRVLFFLKNSAVIVFLLGSSLLVSHQFYDGSTDGMWYHQSSIYCLKNGWNPFKEEYCSSVAREHFRVQNFPKGIEIPQAILYSFFNTVEIAKAMNYLVLFASIFLTVACLHDVGRFSRKQIVLGTVLLNCNPSVFANLHTFLIDGQISNLFLCFLVSCYFICRYRVGFIFFFLFGILLIILTSVKVTILLIIGVLTLSLLCFIFLQKQYILCKKIIICSGISVFISIAFINYHPYITNSLLYNNPVYPLSLDDSVDMIGKNQYDSAFYYVNHFKKLALCIFASDVDREYFESTGIKKPLVGIPFTPKIKEFVSSKGEFFADFGIYFSEIYILSFVLLMFVLHQCAKKNIQYCIIYFLGSLLLSVVIVPGGWIMRYVPHFWFIPVSILLFYYYICSDSKKIKYIVYALSFYIGVNYCQSLLPRTYAYSMKTYSIAYQLEQMKQSPQPIEVELGSIHNNRISGKIRLEEYGIQYKDVIFSERDSLVLMLKTGILIREKSLSSRCYQTRSAPIP